MSDTETTETAVVARPPIPRTLETPPRSTGNAQKDFPIMIDWFYRAYQVIQAAVNFINGQVTENPDLDVTNLPDPATSTIAQAQTTANQAYALAVESSDATETAQTEIDALETKFAANVDGTVTISDAAVGDTVAFAAAQADTNYTVMIQAKSITGAPATGAYTKQTKTYATGNFSFTLVAAPGAGTSITFDWQLVRNT